MPPLLEARLEGALLAGGGSDPLEGWKLRRRPFVAAQPRLSPEHVALLREAPRASASKGAVLPVWAGVWAKLGVSALRNVLRRPPDARWVGRETATRRRGSSRTRMTDRRSMTDAPEPLAQRPAGRAPGLDVLPRGRGTRRRSLNAACRSSRSRPTAGRRAAGFPVTGPLRAVAEDRLALVLDGERPFAFSARGWRERPGVVVRALRTPRTSVRFGRRSSACARTSCTPTHCSALPEAAVARSCGLPDRSPGTRASPTGPEDDDRAHATRRASPTSSSACRTRSARCSAAMRAARRCSPCETASRSPRMRALRSEVSAVHGRHRGDGVAHERDGCVPPRGPDRARGAARPCASSTPAPPDLHRDDGLDAELARLAAEILPPDALLMLGYVPSAEVLPRWSVFVCSSRSEAFPLATLEAMALGIPVIATTVGGIPEQIDHLESGHPRAAGRSRGDRDLARTPARRRGAASATRTTSPPRASAREFTLARQAEGLHRAYLTALNRRFAPLPVRRPRPRRSHDDAADERGRRRVERRDTLVACVDSLRASAERADAVAPDRRRRQRRRATVQSTT